MSFRVRVARRVLLDPDTNRRERAMENQQNDALFSIVDAFIARVVANGTIREGIVMTLGKTPYRRLDCDGRALAYIKTRPKKGAVRVDVSGLWMAPQASRLSVPSATGGALMISSESDIEDAAKYLIEIVQHTRERRAAREARMKKPAASAA